MTPVRQTCSMRHSVVAAGILVSSFTVWGCGTLPVVEQVPVSDPRPLSEHLRSRQLFLDRVVSDIPRGTVIGESRRGHACVFPEDLKWYDDIKLQDGQYHREFERIVKRHNYRLLEKPTSLFERYKFSGTELVLGAKITNVKENICWGLGGWNLDQSQFRGNVRFSVHWEVFSVSRQKVLLFLDTEASAQVDDFTRAGENNYYATAFGNAVKRLLANPDFHRLVTNDLEER